MTTFSELGVGKAYIRALQELEILYPTKIQEAVIPVLLGAKTDLVGLAQTGTGKTAAFGLPLLHAIDASKAEVQGLIIAPTRELVQQIQKQLFKFTKYTEAKIFVEGVFGGEIQWVDLIIGAEYCAASHTVRGCFVVVSADIYHHIRLQFETDTEHTTAE